MGVFVRVLNRLGIGGAVVGGCVAASTAGPTYCGKPHSLDVVQMINDADPGSTTVCSVIGITVIRRDGVSAGKSVCNDLVN